MARKRVAPFDPPTLADFEKLGPERVRRGPRAGYMWLCEAEGGTCGASACHMTRDGKKVCKRHGGSTAAQRDPIKQALAAVSGQEPQRPPGRPVKHGFYSTVEGMRVDELVAEYRAGGLNPDATDDDMLYLRAYLDELKSLRPDTTVTADLLKTAISLIMQFQGSMTDEKNAQTGAPMNVMQVLVVMGLIEELRKNLDGLRETLKELRALTAGLEDRHAQLINLAKVRAETRLKNSAAQQLDVFTTMIQRLEVILSETLPSNYKDALLTRFAKELQEVPITAVKVKA